VDAGELVRLRALVPHVHCESSVRRYLIAVIQATRRHPALELGASPRASLALFRASRALAAIRGRDYVLPDDIKFLAPVLLPHRLILGSQSRLRGRDAAGVLEEVLAEVAAPVEG
jgi:MoxR-like ATPase